MKTLYLDMNIYNRPYDDQSQVRIRLETIAIFEILNMMKSGQAHVAWSFILDYENSLNPHDDIRLEVEHIASFATEMIEVDESIRQLAKTYESQGVKPRDALHLACAETSGVTYFVTCDDKLLNKHKVLTFGFILINPIDFILGYKEVDNDNDQ